MRNLCCGSSMEPRGSTGADPTMGSQQLQSKMLQELLEAWPIETLREAGKDKADIKKSAVGCQVLKREAGEAVAKSTTAVQDGGGPAMPSEAGGAKGFLLCGLEDMKRTICKEPVAPGRVFTKRMFRSMGRMEGHLPVQEGWNWEG